MSGLTSASFQKLVQALKKSKKTCTVVEQCCGGTINASIMAQPGASAVFYGGSVVYTTRKGKGLLLNDDELYRSLTLPPPSNKDNNSSSTDGTTTSNAADAYIQSKFDWTAKTSVAFCKALKTDFAIAEGGASGPTFRPDDMDSGFAVLSVAGRDGDGAKVLKQKVIHSNHADRQKNMRLFADTAAELMIEVLETEEKDGVDVRPIVVGEMLNGGEKDDDDDDGDVILDRATTLRSDSIALAEMEPRAKYVLVRNNEILVRSSTKLALLSNDDVAHLKDTHNQVTFLGILSDAANTPIFGIDVIEEDDTNLSSSSYDGCCFVNTRTNAPLLPRLHNELALHITAYANWQRNAAFCPSCGAPTLLLHAGTARQCTSCKTLSWPRQDPSMIASITSRCGQRILLARSKRHPPKLHTVLAGFVEAGETFEAAVARETWEETGLRIDGDSVRYIGSQPWPFPQSCMVAFSATADDSQTLDIDEEELVSARWFDREEVVAATRVEGAVMRRDVAEAALEADPSLNLLVPPKLVIARTLIDTWLEKS